MNPVIKEMSDKVVANGYPFLGFQGVMPDGLSREELIASCNVLNDTCIRLEKALAETQKALLEARKDEL